MPTSRLLPVTDLVGDLATPTRALRRKVVLVATSFWACYALVLAPVPVLIRVPALLGAVLGAYAWITCIMHDANHGALAPEGGGRDLVGRSLDVFGASSLLWREKHNRLHHLYTNSPELDPDIRQDPFFRLGPGERWRPWHRAQHLYAPLLYGFLPFVFFFSDFLNSAMRKSRGVPFSFGLTARDLVVMGLFKALFVVWLLVVPVAVHGPLALAVIGPAAWVVGVLLSVTVQLAHVNDLVVQVPETPEPGNTEEFVRHQLATTADIRVGPGRTARMVNWLAGGLWQQTVHHLVPAAPHTAYLGLIPACDALAARHGCVRLEHPSLPAALRSHFRWLQMMGRRPEPAAVAIG